MGLDKETQMSPEVYAYMISKLFFLWLFKLLIAGTKRKLDESDIYDCVPDDLTEALGDKLETVWRKEMLKHKSRPKYKPSLLGALFKVFKASYLTYGLLLFLQCLVLRILQPLMTYKIIHFFQYRRRGVSYGLTEASIFVSISFVDLVIFHHALLGCSRIGIRTKIACSSLLYRKILSLSINTRGKFTDEYIINLLTERVNKLESLPVFLHYIWIAPLQITLALYVAFNVGGYSPLIGFFGVVGISIPLQGLLFRRDQINQRKLVPVTKIRLDTLQLALRYHKEIKMYGCEMMVEDLIQSYRIEELVFVKRRLHILGAMTVLLYFVDRIAMSVTIMVHIINDTLTSEVLYTIIQIFWTLQLQITVFFPLAVASIIENKSAVQHVQRFLLLPEKTDDPKLSNIKIDMVNGQIIVANCTAGFSGETATANFVGLTVNLKPGIFYGITGQDNSGKSAFVFLLLRELPIVRGRVFVSGKISFASQYPWIINKSVRKNIVFGQTFDRNRYKDVLNVLQLTQEIKEFPYGDKTLIGIHVLLTPTQKYKFNLARCIYMDAHIYIFDEVFDKMVDEVHIRSIFEDIVAYIKGKTIIIVTKYADILQKADKILLLENGTISEKTYNQLDPNMLLYMYKKSYTTLKVLVEEEVKVKNPYEDYEEEEEQESIQENKKTHVTYKNFWGYLKNRSRPQLDVYFMIILIISQIVVNCCDCCLMYWTKSDERCMGRTEVKDIHIIVKNKLIEFDFLKLNWSEYPVRPYAGNVSAACDSVRYTRDMYMQTYLLLVTLTMGLLVVRTYYFCRNRISCSNFFHVQLLSAFMNADLAALVLSKMNTHKLFTEDIFNLDQIIPKTLLLVILISFMFFGVLLIIILMAPYLFPLAGILVYFIFKIRDMHLTSSQDIVLILDERQTQLATFVRKTLQGHIVIRAFQFQFTAYKQFHYLSDEITSASVLILLFENMASFYADFLLMIFTSTLTFHFFLLPKYFFNFNAPIVGFTITQSLSLMGSVQFALRQTSKLSNYVLSIERILNFLDVKQELLTEAEPPDQWPVVAALSIRQVNLSPDNEVQPLINFNLEILPEEKIGILYEFDRPSLFYAIFALYPIEGKILLDGIDMTSISPDFYRKHISYIPHEPIIFPENIRHNVDINSRFTDEEVWIALEKVQLKRLVPKLTAMMGDEFTVFHKHLICIARALINRNKIVLIEDATETLDKSSEDLINHIIRKEFINCTLLTMTQRLVHVADYDKILFIDYGTIVQYGEPAELLRAEGKIKDMLDKLTPDERKQLTAIAEGEL